MATQLVVMVAEKPSIAAAVSRVLARGEARSVGHGSLPVYAFEMPFMGKRSNVRFTSVAGHVFSRDFPPNYQNWADDPARLFEAPTIRTKDGNKGVTRHLKSVCSGAQHLVLWLDNDREGENICFEVISVVNKVMSPENSRNQDSYIHRAIFSAVTDEEVNRAMRNLTRPDINQSNAVDVRQEIDLKIGVAFTRFQTNYFGARYPELSRKTISFGPCQTPTLAFCVQRHDKIVSFKPEPYWALKLLLPPCDPETSSINEMQKSAMVARSNKSLAIPAKWCGGRIMSQADAVKMLKELEDGQKQAKVINVVNKIKSRQKPRALNTVQLLQLASRLLGMSPNTTMNIAEGLYTRGYISYPRTETSAYPDSMNIRGMVSNLSRGIGNIAADAQTLLSEGINIPKGGKDCGDHPPIMPTNPVMSSGELSGDSERLYNLVARNFLGSLSTACKMASNTVQFRVENPSNNAEPYIFEMKGTKIIEPGYMKYTSYGEKLESDDVRKKDNSLPEYKKGQSIPIAGADISQKMTKPPSELTEAELLAKMDKYGIGTDASMATHVENICQRGYVVAGGNSRYLTPTALGISFIHGLGLIDKDLIDPRLRGNIEANIARIANGIDRPNYVLTQSLKLFKEKYNNFVKNIPLMEALIAARTMTKQATTGHVNPQKLLGRCGKCRRYMYKVRNPPRYTGSKPEDEKDKDKHKEEEEEEEEEEILEDSQLGENDRRKDDTSLYSIHGLYCEYCDMLYFVPEGALRGRNTDKTKLSNAGGITCPLDNFELMECVFEKSKKRILFCPYCYNNKVERKENGKVCPMKCSTCNEKCKFSLQSTGIGPCPLCEASKMKLDLTSQESQDQQGYQRGNSYERNNNGGRGGRGGNYRGNNNNYNPRGRGSRGGREFSRGRGGRYDPPQKPANSISHETRDMEDTIVKQESGAEKGTLCVQRMSPMITCNNCEVMFTLGAGNCQDVSIANPVQMCKCGRKKVQCKFNTPEGMKVITGCVVCDKEVEAKPYVQPSKYRGGGRKFGRGRGRGRGRSRGRGRGHSRGRGGSGRGGGYY